MTTGPIDYRLDIVDPFTQAAQGYQQGIQMYAANNAIQAQKAEDERKKQAEMQQQAMQKDLFNFSQIPNKTAKDYSDIISRYPSLAEPYQKSWEMLDTGQRQQALSTAGQVMSAIKTNNPNVAQDILEEQAVAYDNSGDKQSALNMRRMKSMISKDPNSIYASLGFFGNAVSPEDFAPIMEKLGTNVREDQKQPYEIAKTQADTAKTNAETIDIPLAATDRAQGVKNQGQKIEYDNQYNYDKLTQDNQQFYDSLTNDQKKEANKLRAAKNETDVQKMARLEKAQSFSNTANNAAGTAKLAAELINDYKKLSDASGAGLWNAAMRNVPGTAEYDFARRVDTLKSQAFLIGSQNLKGLGAMTEMEGKKVTDALGNLDLSQNTAQVAQQLAVIAKAANAVAQNANKNAQNYATKGRGYSPDVVKAAQTLGITPAEAQKFVNDHGL